MNPSKPTRKTSESLRNTWPLLKELIRPRQRLLVLGVFLIVVDRATGLVLPSSARILVDNIITRKETGLLIPVVLAVVGAAIVQAVCSLVLTQLLSKEGLRLVTELRCRVQNHIGRLPVAYYDATKASTLASRIIWDVESLRHLVGTGLVNLIGGLLTAVFSLIVLLRISVVLTCVAVFFITLFAIFLSQGLRRMRPMFRRQTELLGMVIGRLSESLAGIRVVKGYHAEAQETKVFVEHLDPWMKALTRSMIAMSLMTMAATVLVGIVGATVIFLGAHEILAGRLTLGQFMMFTAFLAFLVAPMAQAVGSGAQLTEALAGLDHIQDILRERPEDQNPRRVGRIGSISGSVSFKNVSFAYQRQEMVLQDVTFEARPGTVTALVGPSGSGKSTIISLLAAFYEPSEGLVSIDGKDLATLRLDSYRTQLGVVFQDTFLFDGTIRENVAYARPGASQADILNACRLARVDIFVERMDKKYETLVGERGIKLSGGQRQRLSIARAILADPRILIFDEATSSLDSESEAAIQESMEYLLQGRTTFVIAHRLSTVRRADQILVIEEGRVVERGTHESLYAAAGRYYDLYNRQHGADADLFLTQGAQEEKDGRYPDGQGTEMIDGSMVMPQ